MPFTIETDDLGPLTIRQAALEITYDGWFAGTEFKVVGRAKPVVAFGSGLDYKRFDLQIRVHSRTEFEDVIEILKDGSTITVTTHQSDVYNVAVAGEIKVTSVKAAPTAGEGYTTRYAWDIVCPVVEV